MAVHPDLAEVFIKTLFTGSPSGSFFHTWTKQDKQSEWCAADSPACPKLNEAHDTYVCGGLFPASYGSNKRGKEAQAIGMVALHLDLDVADPDAHQKSDSLPPTVEDAVSILAEMPLPASVVVNSGHGLQAWYFFEKPLMFIGPDALTHAKDMARTWTRLAQGISRRKGWTMDSTFDLVRLMRLPGTVNNKVEGKPADVTLLDVTGNRYTVAQIMRAIELPAGRTASLPDPPRVAVETGETVDEAVLDVLLEEAAFRVRFEELQAASLSESEFDLAVGNLVKSRCAAAGVAEAEQIALVTKVIQAVRSRFSARPDKALRSSYLTPTVSRVMQDRPDYTPVKPGPKPAPATEKSEASDRDASIALLNSILLLDGCENQILAVVKLMAEEPEYLLRFTDGTSHTLGGIEKLMSAAAVAHAISAATRVYCVPPKGPRLEQLRQTLLDAIQEESIGAEATLSGQARFWVESLMSSGSGQPMPQDMAASAAVYVTDDLRVVVTGQALQAHIKVVLGEGGIGHKTFGKAMRAAGCTPHVVRTVKRNGAVSTRSVWRLPDSPDNRAIAQAVMARHAKESDNEQVQGAEARNAGPEREGLLAQ